ARPRPSPAGLAPGRGDEHGGDREARRHARRGDVRGGRGAAVRVRGETAGRDQGPAARAPGRRGDGGLVRPARQLLAPVWHATWWKDCFQPSSSGSALSSATVLEIEPFIFEIEARTCVDAFTISL